MTLTPVSIHDHISSVATTNPTLFDADGAVDHEAVASHVRFLVDSGIRLIIPCGNTGEFSSLGLDEAKAIVSTTVEAAAGGAAVVAGVGWSSPIARELALHAQDAGASAVMIHHPVHCYIDRLGLRSYYEEIIGAIAIPVVLYKRGPQLTDELLLELVRHDQVVLVKYAVNELGAFASVVERADADVAWMCGTAERWAPFFHLAGAGSFSSGLANFAPQRAIELAERLAAGDYAGAMRLRAELAPFEDLREGDHSAKNVPAVKEAMRQLGLCTSARVRDPLRNLSDKDAEYVAEILSGWRLPGRQLVSS